MVDTFAILQAFAAGVLSFFAPCSVAMLPAYIGWYLRGEVPAMAGQPARRSPLALGLLAASVACFAGAVLYYDQVNQGFARITALPVALLLLGLALAALAARAVRREGWGRALELGALTAAGILAVFALLGVPFVVLFGVLTFQQLVVAVLLMGALLVALGVLGLLGKELSVALPVRAPQARSRLAFLGFGVAYGLVSMGCTLPLFLLGAVAPIVRSGDAPTALLGAVSFGAGMASVMLITTLGLFATQGLAQRRLRALVPHVKVASNVVLVLAGLYVIWYDLTVLMLTA